MEKTIAAEESTTGLDPKRYIYRVPYYFRKGNEECYQPLELSIGPVFYNDPNYVTMQEFKHVFLKYFIKHPYNAYQSVEPYTKFVRENESKIRECYQHQKRLSTMSSDVFIKMMVLDAAFLIYYFLLSHSLYHHGPPACPPTSFVPSIQNLGVAYERVWRDLFVEENQLPFFVLKGIYEIAFGHLNSCVPFIDLVLEIIGLVTNELPWHEAIRKNINAKKITDASAGSIKHLVHLLRKCCLPSDELPSDSEVGDNSEVAKLIQKQNKFRKHQVHLPTECSLPFRQQQRDSKSGDDSNMFPSAKRLRDAGVRFKLNKSDDKFQINFDKYTGELTIYKFTLDDNSEALFRNILFFEQCWPYYKNKYFSNLFCFLDDLVDTVEDIQILKKSEILHNQLGSDEDAKDLFNNLAKNILYDRVNMFSNFGKDLEFYSSLLCSRWNRWKAILWSKYFNHPWAIMSVIAAVILLILTVLQTITGFLQLD